jgi:hypothetical protein
VLPAVPSWPEQQPRRDCKFDLEESERWFNMSGPTEFTIGSEVCSGDGPCGELRRVVIDPVSGALTHLVVGPRGRERAIWYR